MKPSSAPGSGFRHEALLYQGRAEFLTRTVPFVLEGLQQGQRVMVAVQEPAIDLIRASLGPAGDEVRFLDIGDAGRNPARIIPAWRDFVADDHADASTAVRGIGEPIWAERSADELIECERHEALLNLAFADDPAFWLLCPYDTETLSPGVIENARRNHPFVLSDGLSDGDRVSSVAFRGLDAIARPFDDPLPVPPDTTYGMVFQTYDLARLRAFTGAWAESVDVTPDRAQDLVLAVDEVASNTLRHGSGHGTLRVWTSGAEQAICEISDEGTIDQPLVGRVKPLPGSASGFGLWLANQLCDLVQIRSSAAGSIVRLHMRLDR